MDRKEINELIGIAFGLGVVIGLAVTIAMLALIRNLTMDAQAAEIEIAASYIDIEEGPESAVYVVGDEDLCPYSDEIPLSRDLQYLLWSECRKYGIDYLFALATIRLESDFNPRAYNNKNKNGTVDRGICQTNSCWTGELKRLGMISSAHDLYDPETGIRCGMWELGRCVALYGNTEKAYAFYNCGDPDVNHTAASRIVWRYYQEYQDRFGRNGE